MDAAEYCIQYHSTAGSEKKRGHMAVSIGLDASMHTSHLLSIAGTQNMWMCVEVAVLPPGYIITRGIQWQEKYDPPPVCTYSGRAIQMQSSSPPRGASPLISDSQIIK